MKLEVKPFPSVQNKAYRRNVVAASKEPSNDQLLTPYNWYLWLGDVLRCTLVVLTIDAVDPVTARIVESLGQNGIGVTRERKSELRGYYASHVSFEWSDRVITPNPPPRDGVFLVEIQIKTFLHHALGQLTHNRYVENRTASAPFRDADWAWEPASSEFQTNMLGHVIQYLDGAISNLRRSV
jgi:hypothetical protein